MAMVVTEILETQFSSGGTLFSPDRDTYYAAQGIIAAALNSCRRIPGQYPKYKC